jgi:hypothetical protein
MGDSIERRHRHYPAKLSMAMGKYKGNIEADQVFRNPSSLQSAPALIPGARRGEQGLDFS